MERLRGLCEPNRLSLKADIKVPNAAWELSSNRRRSHTLAGEGRGPARCWGSLWTIDGPPPAGCFNDAWDRDVGREQCRTYPQALHSFKAYQRRPHHPRLCGHPFARSWLHARRHKASIMACVLHRGGLGVVPHPAPNALDVVLPIEHGSKLATATDARRQRRFTERDVHVFEHTKTVAPDAHNQHDSTYERDGVNCCQRVLTAFSDLPCRRDQRDERPSADGGVQSRI
jgi:hypothetical protein